jgi:murein DD-endopeptidase MepM/ murein hydrolase activator NlpD
VVCHRSPAADVPRLSLATADAAVPMVRIIVPVISALQTPNGYGTSVDAPDEGVVTAVNTGVGHITGPYDYNQSGPLPNMITVTTSDGYKVSYMHVDPSVGVGSRVHTGQPIGVVDDSGRTTGPHTHVQIIDPSGQRIDPLIYFPDCL